ncbi:nitroreductase family protein [Gracilinema caldarium]|uniref:nitroreductase family protein n=1 Tax=Gracilinema caldarium TaxID=215591 RepID=UPI0026EC1319|nr:nitroreductase family protein [Gracilinema caldarium]
MNTLLDLIFSRHSIRDYTGEIIKNEDIELIVKAGMAAPSAVNVQPWAFIIINKKDKLINLSKLLPYAKMLEQSGAAIIVCGVPDKDMHFANKYWIQDCSAASENILLAAHSLGYGAVWTAVYPEEKRINDVRIECNIPNNIIPLNVIAIGVPKNKNMIPIDKYKIENIHWNTW